MNSIKEADREVYEIILNELHRQQDSIELIASENFVSKAVLAACGSVLTNKYAEGYPRKRYYDGCEFVDEVEALAIHRAKLLFNCTFANVQPHSGTQANQAIFTALLKPYDKLMSLSLDCGGHLTHGSDVSMSGKWFNVVHYKLNAETHMLDYDRIYDIAQREKPKLIIAGYSAYPRIIDFKKFREIADSVDAYLMADVAHYAGLIAAKLYPDPFPYAHVATATTHKTLRGPRGGMILWNDGALSKSINSAVFPGIQGGPLMHIIAAKAIAFKEAMSHDFKQYAENVVKNAKAMAARFAEVGVDTITGGTDSHMVLLDLRKHGVHGVTLSRALSGIGITCNKNSIPFDELKPAYASGVRIGTPAITTRGMTAAICCEIASSIADCINALKDTNDVDEFLQTSCAKDVHERVKVICARYPLYKDLYERE
ncbi:Serine hydroxymethyltransferase [Candidatus Fokinia solitaria]|uniref:Serine hydroxymethyltransferase n=1 Tax=Candidatus Fokinia solitaria TaxID=1802984 RepID=A0A2U8BRR6_9RICK|nr:serine hydroxymethyltransferase [Candidatus Fokinia solitaria]AWD33029.1 Serine hydroxymethyltransferase [Candidatus Fokinia solitaria]